MKKYAQKLLVLSAIAITAINTSYATQAAPAPSTTKDAAIVYVNGMDNTFDDAVASQTVLKTAVSNNYPNKQYVYGVAYNADAGGLTAVYNAKTEEGKSPQDFWTAIDGGTDGKSTGNTDTDAALEQTDLATISKNSMPELSKHLAIYRAYLADQRSVVLVGHSQGTLYANFALNFLLNGPNPTTGKISSVNVADCAAYLEPKSSYITSTSDAVVGALRIVSSVLPSNTQIGFSFADVTGHSFVKTYMSKASKQISDMVYQQS